LYASWIFSLCRANNLVTPEARFLSIFIVSAAQGERGEERRRAQQLPRELCCVLPAPKKATNRLRLPRRVGEGRQQDAR